MKKSDFGDIIEVVIVLAVFVAGLFYTAHGLSDQGSVSGSHNWYTETEIIESHEDCFYPYILFLRTAA